MITSQGSSSRLAWRAELSKLNKQVGLISWDAGTEDYTLNVCVHFIHFERGLGFIWSWWENRNMFSTLVRVCPLSDSVEREKDQETLLLKENKDFRSESPILWTQALSSWTWGHYSNWDVLLKFRPCLPDNKSFPSLCPFVGFICYRSKKIRLLLVMADTSELLRSCKSSV